MESYQFRSGANLFHPRCVDKMWNSSACPAFWPSDLKSNASKGDGTMHQISPGVWTCAALYVAIGLLGIFFLATGPGVATSSEGYGVAAIAVPARLR
jgi:hypothetical protein